MRAVNLLPVDSARRSKRWEGVREGKVSKRVLVYATVAAGVLTAAVAGAFVHAHLAVSDNKATLASLEQEVAAAEATAAPVRAARADAQGRRAAVTAVTSRRITWEQVLNDLSRVLPRNVRLENLQAQSPTPTVAVSTAAPATTTAATGSAPTAFVVTGFTSSQKSVARVLDRLAVLPWLSEVSLQSTTRADSGNGRMAVQFTIGANLSSTGGQ